MIRRATHTEGSMKESGFTLVELLVVVVITAILASVAIPNFLTLVQANAIASQSNGFTSTLSLARSEAVTRNTRVLVCKRNTAGTACDNSQDWEAGWIVFADNDGDNSVDAGEEIRVLDALDDNYTLRVSAAANWLAFQSDGRVRQNNAGSTGDATTFNGLTFRLCSPSADNTSSREISINVVGRASLDEGTTSCP